MSVSSLSLDDDDDDDAIMLAITSSVNAVVDEQDCMDDGVCAYSHTSLPRGKRRDYSHDVAKRRVLEDFLCPRPLFKDKEFQRFFRVSRARFERIMVDIRNSGDPRKKTSIEAKILLPLKTCLWSVPQLFQRLLSHVLDCVKDSLFAV